MLFTVQAGGRMVHLQVDSYAYARRQILAAWDKSPYIRRLKQRLRIKKVPLFDLSIIR